MLGAVPLHPPRFAEVRPCPVGCALSSLLSSSRSPSPPRPAPTPPAPARARRRATSATRTPVSATTSRTPTPEAAAQRLLRSCGRELVEGCLDAPQLLARDGLRRFRRQRCELPATFAEPVLDALDAELEFMQAMLGRERQRLRHELLGRLEPPEPRPPDAGLEEEVHRDVRRHAIEVALAFSAPAL